jgi:cytochrome o ubiquinol oxidase subunit IV
MKTDNNSTKHSTTSESSVGSNWSYLLGFGLSVALTTCAFLLVQHHVNTGHRYPSDNVMLIALSALAIIQLFVQLVFFLHLDKESKPRWNTTVLLFAAMVVFILVAGSLWIMTNLNYHHEGYGKTHDGHTLTTPSQTNQYIIHDEGVQP